MKLISILRFLLLVMLAKSSFADDAVKTSQLVNANEWKFGATLGYGQLGQPVRMQKDITLFIIPDIRFYGEKLSIENLNISYALIEQPLFVIELVGQQNVDGIYFPGDHRNEFAAVSGNSTFGRRPMLNRAELAEVIAEEEIIPRHKSMSYMAGVEFRRYGIIDYFITALYDISKVHHGYELNLTAHYQQNIGPFITNFELGIRHKSAKMSNYYYGVDYAQFQQNNYTSGSANNVYMQYTMSYPVSKNWYALAVVKQQWLGRDIRRSPVTDQSNILSYFFGIKYMY